MQNKSDNFFDIFDLFQIITRNLKKFIFVSLIYCLTILIIPYLISSIKSSKYEITFIIENENSLSSKNTAFSNFITLGNLNIENLYSSNDFDINFSKIFFHKYILGIENEILSLPLSPYLSSEYRDFFSKTSVEGISDTNIQIIYYDPHNREMIYDERFLQELVKELNLRMQKTIYEFLTRKNKDLQILSKIHLDIFNETNSPNYFKNINILNTIYNKNKSVINEYLVRDIDSHFIFQEQKKIENTIFSFRYYLFSLFIYIYITIFVIVLIYGYQKKLDLKKIP